MGVPPDEPTIVVNRRTGFSHGQAVPEADREVFTAPLSSAEKIVASAASRNSGEYQYTAQLSGIEGQFSSGIWQVDKIDSNLNR